MVSPSWVTELGVSAEERVKGWVGVGGGEDVWGEESE